MTDYRLSQEADRDIYALALYTVQTWNEAQADRYVTGLHQLLSKLARNPYLGIKSDDLRPGYFRRRYRSHMIFYKKARRGILIVRVLHAQADHLRHL